METFCSQQKKKGFPFSNQIGFVYNWTKVLTSSLCQFSILLCLFLIRRFHDLREVISAFSFSSHFKFRMEFANLPYDREFQVSRRSIHVFILTPCFQDYLSFYLNFKFWQSLKSRRNYVYVFLKLYMGPDFLH